MKKEDLAKRDTQPDAEDGRFLAEDLVDTSQIDITPVARKILRANRGGKRACLVVLQGTEIGNIIPLEKGVLLIGRSPECNTVLLEDGISRVHARIKVSALGEVVIQDMNSTNGTFVEGRRIRKATLEAGDKVLLGRNTVLKYVLQDELDELYQQEMYESSTRDALTGVHNRKYLNERILADLSYAKRHSVAFTFIIFDIDKFKKVNDTFGHQSGDNVLVAVAGNVAQMIRTEDVLGRYGGEEFAIIALKLDYSGGVALGERIRKQVAQTMIPAQDEPDQVINVTVSLGVATVDADAEVDAETVVQIADRNLYQAKQSGRNRVVASRIP